MMKHKEFVKAVRLACNGYQVFARRNGTCDVRKGYFYRIGDADDWAAEVRRRLTEAGLNVTVVGEDHYANWPKESYFKAIVTQVEEAAR